MVSMLYLVRQIRVWSATATLSVAAAQLYSARQRLSTFRESDLMVRRLIRLTVETGSACAINAILVLVFFFALPDTDVFLGVYVVALLKLRSSELIIYLSQSCDPGQR